MVSSSLDFLHVQGDRGQHKVDCFQFTNVANNTDVPSLFKGLPFQLLAYFEDTKFNCIRKCIW